MTQYQQKTIPVDAVQFLGPDEKGELLAGVVSTNPVSFLYTIGGLRDIRVGDFIVRHADRVHDILSPEQFAARYEAVPEAN